MTTLDDEVKAVFAKEFQAELLERTLECDALAAAKLALQSLVDNLTAERDALLQAIGVAQDVEEGRDPIEAARSVREANALYCEDQNAKVEEIGRMQESIDLYRATIARVETVAGQCNAAVASFAEAAALPENDYSPTARALKAAVDQVVALLRGALRGEP